jgi:hypothetical protein
MKHYYPGGKVAQENRKFMVLGHLPGATAVLGKSAEPSFGRDEKGGFSPPFSSGEGSASVRRNWQKA